MIPTALMRAMDDVYGVFSVQPYTASEIQQGVAVIEAANRQEVSHFVYSSVGSVDDDTGIPHFEPKVKWKIICDRAACSIRFCGLSSSWRTGRGSSATRSGTDRSSRKQNGAVFAGF